ncbi:uncharacterized protein CELE_T27D12.6 [Caenorhabditis elegans]|uniref:Uncharacterized protein n=1 Tax=Caenorhabditis elegans TaxID=6239 RepID=D1MN76_CAEEL|nr:Uncharacterized protein CELE_T27D12.6 [Caenorhabditis elegans]CBI63234.2 Uncharacterized protein CELE_T27D12.6 [Caenorhabditis elegans]|eukprot:NP_001254319.1 Uncharacterized protein CELE_T27D12.6 [Caenorhabditis elegans]
MMTNNPSKQGKDLSDTVVMELRASGEWERVRIPERKNETEKRDEGSWWSKSRENSLYGGFRRNSSKIFRL